MSCITARLVVLAGMAAAGRTTLSRAIASLIPNAFHITRDDILYGGLLYVSPTKTPRLPPFSEYVKNDNVFPDHAILVKTPFDEMTSVPHSSQSDFYKRHGRDQSFLIQGRIAAEALKTGKVPIVDGFLGNNVKFGSLARFMDQEYFAGYPKRLIYVVIDEEECWRRLNARAEHDAEAKIRSLEIRLNKEAAMEVMKKNHPRNPEGLADLPHHHIDTTGRTIEECVAECIAYISSEPS